MPTTTIRRALIGIASVTAGVAAAAVAPAPAYAADPDPATIAEFRAMKARIKAAMAAQPAPAALPTCHGVINLNGPGGTVAHIPAVANGVNPYCQMQNGDYDNPGAKVLQMALHDCNGERNLAIDADYGPDTRDAVKRTQGEVGMDQTGIYTVDLYINAPWPFYDSAGNLEDCI